MNKSNHYFYNGETNSRKNDNGLKNYGCAFTQLINYYYFCSDLEDNGREDKNKRHSCTGRGFGRNRRQGAARPAQRFADGQREG